ncbi:MAG TPA: redoxin family protein [Terriglobales bacterium]|nr:redoxin family protein [Terriglobales bacterium]
MLVQEVASKYAGKVTFVSENFGASKLAERFGVTRYPAVFVDDVLVAKPRDFGFFGEGEKAGRYTPWRNADNQARFRDDLTRMIEQILAGKKSEAVAAGQTVSPSDEIATLPDFALTDLSGKPLNREQLAGKVVLVEFWATWCPPCQSTLEWLGSLKKKYGADIEVVALAVESPDDKVKSMVNSLSPELRWAIADAKTAQAFGDVVAVPTLFLFDRSGKSSRVLFGAPPDLHEQAEGTLDLLVKQPVSKPAPSGQ